MIRKYSLLQFFHFYAFISLSFQKLHLTTLTTGTIYIVFMLLLLNTCDKLIKNTNYCFHMKDACIIFKF